MSGLLQAVKNLRSDESYVRLAGALRGKDSSGAAHLFLSPGNWGDALINEGTRNFLSHFEIEAIELRRADLDSAPSGSRDLAIIGGGGGWNRNWHSTVEFTGAVSARYANVVVLPSSYDVELTNGQPLNNVLKFSRALVPPALSAEFCHDMAFFCEPIVTVSSKLPYPLIALRRDKERHVAALNPDRNLDISLLGDADTSAGGFFELLARFEEVYTDRLHVAIASAMLGVQVHLLEGNYGKNAGVFRASLQYHFPNVRMMAWDEFASAEVVGALPIGKPGYGEVASNVENV